MTARRQRGRIVCGPYSTIFEMSICRIFLGFRRDCLVNLQYACLCLFMLYQWCRRGTYRQLEKSKNFRVFLSFLVGRPVNHQGWEVTLDWSGANQLLRVELGCLHAIEADRPHFREDVKFLDGIVFSHFQSIYYFRDQLFDCYQYSTYGLYATIETPDLSSQDRLPVLTVIMW